MKRITASAWDGVVSVRTILRNSALTEEQAAKLSDYIFNEHLDEGYRNLSDFLYDVDLDDLYEEAVSSGHITVSTTIEASSAERLNELVEELSENYGAADLIWYIANKVSSIDKVVECLELLADSNGADIDVV